LKLPCTGFSIQRKDDADDDVGDRPRDERDQPERRLAGQGLVERERQAETEDEMPGQAPGDEGEGVAEGLGEDGIDQGPAVVEQGEGRAGGAGALGREAQLEGDGGGEHQHPQQQEGGGEDEQEPGVPLAEGRRPPLPAGRHRAGWGGAGRGRSRHGAAHPIVAYNPGARLVAACASRRAGSGALTPVTASCTAVVIASPIFGHSARSGSHFT